jgi:hypothetical protein
MFLFCFCFGTVCGTMMLAMSTGTTISCGMGRQDEPVYLSLDQIEQTEHSLV